LGGTGKTRVPLRKKREEVKRRGEVRAFRKRHQKLEKKRIGPFRVGLLKKGRGRLDKQKACVGHKDRPTHQQKGGEAVPNQLQLLRGLLESERKFGPPLKKGARIRVSVSRRDISLKKD